MRERNFVEISVKSIPVTFAILREGARLVHLADALLHVDLRVVISPGLIVACALDCAPFPGEAM